MKKNTKKLTAVLGTFALALSVTACGGSGDDKSQTSGQDTAAAVTEEAATEQESGEAESGSGEISGTITVWEHDYHFEACVKDVIAGFEKKYPDVTVEYEIKDDNYDSILSTAITSDRKSVV